MPIESPWDRNGYCLFCDRDAHHSAACSWVAGLAARVTSLEEQLKHATADKTRALLRGTVKGFAAGENADAKHWRERAETAERRNAEVEAQLEAIEAVLRGEPVSDFMLSFPPVRIVAEAREFAGKIQYLVDWADNNKLLEEHVFTFPDGDTWEAKKR